MILGEEKLHEAVTALMASIGEDADTELADIAEVFVIATVHYGTTEDGGGDIGSTFYHCSSGRGYVQRGLLEEARRAVDNNVTPRDE